MILEGHKFYDRVLKIPVNRSGAFSIKQNVKKSNTKLVTANFRTSFMGGHDKEDICYPYETTWHSLMEDGEGVWMTDLPIEQAQHDTMLDGNVYGTVLIGGLGLGYAAQLIASQPQVDRIIVVEKSQDVVNLVWKHLTFPTWVETHIVVDDLFQYLKQECKKERSDCGNAFDCGFYDIWKSDGEYTFHETVIPLRNLSFPVIDGPLYCWNEDIMRGQLMLGLHSDKVMLTTPFPGIKELKLKELAQHHPKKEFWHNWKVPYYKAIQNKVFELDNNVAMANYVKFYGRPDLVNHMYLLLTKGIIYE